MKFTALSLAFAAIVSATLTVRDAAAVSPFTEEFTTNHSDWSNYNDSAFATWVSSGGPDGGSYLSGAANTASAAPNARFVVLRGEDGTNASGGAFHGDWQASGIFRLSAYVRHNAPEALPYFIRLSHPANTPGTSGLWSPPVPANVWTQLTFDFLPSNIGTTIFPGSAPMDYLATFNGTMTNVAHLQVGFIVSASMANNGTSFTYDLDKVSISAVPEPASGLLLIGAVGYGLVSRRRRSR